MNAPENALNALSEGERRCEWCSKPFAARRAWARFCGPKCRNDFHSRPAKHESRIAELESRVAALESRVAAVDDPLRRA